MPFFFQEPPDFEQESSRLGLMLEQVAEHNHLIAFRGEREFREPSAMDLKPELEPGLLRGPAGNVHALDLEPGAGGVIKEAARGAADFEQFSAGFEILDQAEQFPVFLDPARLGFQIAFLVHAAGEVGLEIFLRIEFPDFGEPGQGPDKDQPAA